MPREPGRPGNDLNRPEIKKLLRMIRGGKVDAVAAAMVAALSRPPEQFPQPLMEFGRHELRLTAVDEETDTTGKAKIDAIRTVARTLRALDRDRRPRGYGASRRTR